MKKSYIIALFLPLLSIMHYIQGDTNQNFNANINMLQQSINMLVTQSNIDPAIAQNILNTTNELSQHVQTNIQQDSQEINIAAALSSLLETANQMSQTINTPGAYALLNSLKFPTHKNVIHKLLMGAYNGDRTKEPTYTNPYIESIGFIINDLVFSAIFQAALNSIAPTAFGRTLLFNTTPQINDWIAQIAAGITAHYAWILQKKLVIQQPQANML